MCYRYQLEVPMEEEEKEEVRKLFSLLNKHYAGQYKTGEILPSDMAPAFASQGQKIGPIVASFGMPLQKKLVINARSESVQVKPFFAESFRYRRLVLPATGFYEWRKEGGKPVEKYLFQVAGDPLFYLCGLYRIEEGRCHFAILTRKASGVMEEIHDREPVIVRPHVVSAYLKEEEAAAEILTSSPPLLQKRSLSSPKGQQLNFFMS